MGLGHNTVNCAREGCYAIITLHPDDENRLRRTHESFYCPAGHKNFFPGKSDEEKEINRLNQRLLAAREQAGYQLQVTNALARSALACPFGCGWSSRKLLQYRSAQSLRLVTQYIERVGWDLAEHLRTEHNATVKPIALIPERAGS